MLREWNNCNPLCGLICVKAAVSRFCYLFKIEKLLEFFIQRDAENERQLGGRAELAGFDGADGVPGHAHHFRQLRLGHTRQGSGCFDPVA